MKFQKLKYTLATAIAIAVLSSSVSLASTDDRMIEKTRETVENAGQYDWYTLAICAKKCFEKNVNLKEAANWLNQSLEIAETPFNLELKGDYYYQNQLPDKALDYYVRAMNMLKIRDGEADIAGIQKKVSKIIHIGG